MTTFAILRRGEEQADVVIADELEIHHSGAAIFWKIIEGKTVDVAEAGAILLPDRRRIVAVYSANDYLSIAPAPVKVVERLAREREPKPDAGGKRPRLVLDVDGESQGYVGDLDLGDCLELVVRAGTSQAWGLDDLAADGDEVEIRLRRVDMTDAEVDALDEA